MAAIFLMGTDRASADETRSLLARWLEWIAPTFYRELSVEALYAINQCIRKALHFLSYGLLGVLDARALREHRGTLNRPIAFQGWAAATAWAAVDEFHQSFSPTRGASIEDVLLDSCGAASAVTLYYLWLNRRPRKS
jgi:VanZ family protein